MAPAPGGAVSPGLRVAVLGAGAVGRTLATAWVRAGHHVVLGSREPGSARLAAALGETGATGTAHHADAARTADAVVVTVPGDQVDALVGELDGALAGRVAIDTTNALTPGSPVLHHVDALVAAGATAFRAFSTTGREQVARPVFGAVRSDLPYAGPDGPGRDDVERLIADVGFRPVWLGADREAFATTDALARLWFQLALGRGWGRRLGLRLLTAADDDPAEEAR